MPGRIIEEIKGKKYKIIIEAGRDPQTGNRKRIVRTVHGRKTEAEKLCADLARELDTGTYIQPTRSTVAEYIREWLESYAKNKAPSTYAGYKRIAQAHIIPKLGSLVLSKLQPMHIQGYYTEQLACGRKDGKGGLSNNTVIRHHALLHKALECAVQWQYLARNPAAYVEVPPAEQAEMHPPTANQLCKLLQLAHGHRDEYLIIAAAYTGMREGELLALAWPNIDLEENSICRVRKTVGYINGQGFVFRAQGKSKKARRDLPLPDVVVAALKAQKKLLAQEKLSAGKKYDGQHNLAFPDTLGRPMDPSALGRRFKKLAVAAGAPDSRFHDLRHRYATDLLEQGEHPRIVQELLGHQTITVTMGTYSHVSPGLQKSAIARLNERLKNINGHQTGTFEKK